MAQLHAAFDLVLSRRPCRPRRRVADAPPVADPVRALWTEWAPWTFLYNLSRQPAITVPMPAGEDGLPRSVQLAAPMYRDDLVLQAAWVIEQMGAFPLAALG